MKSENAPAERKEKWVSSALKVNLERTAVPIEIPEKYGPLLTVVEGHYGLQTKTRELLTELNHPFINWECVLKELKSLSVGDFHLYNRHPDGLRALSLLFAIYLDAIRLPASGAVRESAIQYLFDYIDTILTQSGEELSRNLAILSGTVETLTAMLEADPVLFRKTSSYLKRLLKALPEDRSLLSAGAFDLLLYKAFQTTYRYWLDQPDPAEWQAQRANGEGEESLAAYREITWPISHAHLKELVEKLESPRPGAARPGDEAAPGYPGMPDYFQIVNGYLTAADRLEQSPAFRGRQHLAKLDFLFGIVACPSLADVHQRALREINLSLKRVFQEGQKEDLDAFVREIFAFLRSSRARHEYRGAILDCITTTAKEVFGQNRHALVDTFVDELIAYGFQYPEIRGTTTDWQVQVNAAHIANIRSWMEIIAMKPRWTKRLLSAMIINLRLGGIFVRDTDLIQKNISALLNAEIAPAYSLIKQLLRIFPVYFSEIGAEGELRDITTEVDELSYRNDRLVYFLRKQSHVESNSRLVEFTEDILRFWFSGDKAFIRKHLPDEVFEQVADSGEYFDGMHRAFAHLFPKVQHDPPKFLEWDTPRVQKELEGLTEVGDRDRKRTGLMIRIYQLLHKKYFPQYFHLLKDMEAAYPFQKAEILALKHALARKNHYASLKIILKFLAALKAKILSPQKTPSYENIYYKRHIAADIPSMYGTYHEEKFEAVGLTLRLESLAGMLFEELAESLNLKFITKQTISRIHTYLWLYLGALELEGISTKGLVAKAKYITSSLRVKGFSIDQYIDVFHFISKGIQDIIRDYYIDAHGANLPVIIGQIFRPDDPPGAPARGAGREEVVGRESENFIRGTIASAFGLQALDNFVSAVIDTLDAELEKFRDNKQILNLVMAYNPEQAVTSLYRKNEPLDNPILLGSKGYFLKELVSFGLRVPPGFIITTEVFRAYRAVFGYKYMFNDLAARVNREIAKMEKMTGRKFGDRSNPLLLSVRSGATISLPGMMSSFLNVGMNEGIAESLAGQKDFQWAAWDSYRRFLQSLGMFQGMNRDVFDAVMDDHKQRYGIERKIQFPPGQMREIALAYKKELLNHGVELIDEPLAQLRHAIEQVFDSWYSAQAKTYRQQMHLSEEWGTAVVVQAMVFGNLNEQSGSGVIFTRDPKSTSSEVTLHGDFIFGVQGDDIVSGLVETYPVSKKQRVSERRDPQISLEANFPEIYAELVRIAEVLIYEKGFNHQEIEFTFEGATRDKLYILQTRDMDQIKTRGLRRFRETPELPSSRLGTGIGVDGGALSGRAVFSEEDIRRFRGAEPGTPLILVRRDTVPDDVGVLLQVEGLLTAKGGSTSHAAVTIPRLNKVGVVGFSKLRVNEAGGFATVDGFRIGAGDFIGLDGSSGTVYSGKHEVETEISYQI